ncbi:enediyne polyketide synthase [Nocardiopsis sp. Huas11]|uniref:type I polyketide synthase n=1 Tax=Nocardiopsis sp. Huas11 TaxID=2183912 RepID=UPI000EB0417F|nr:type I polyketide synthase [Nocardiopsis sp. Huas11]RKS08152.1 enediyne polyketide synthase [Nocardiopsis sp. Huas11]
MTGIAIVGMACAYGGAATPTTLWENSVAGRASFRRIPAERLSLADYGSDTGADPDRITVTHASVLEDYAFDRAAFGVAGSTYRATDLTHWLALDVAGRALADAGLDPAGAMSGADAEETAVLVGNTLAGEFTRANVLRTRWPYVRRVVADLLRDRGMDDPDLLEELRARFVAPFPEPDGDTLAGGLSNTIAGRICSHYGFGGGGYTVDGACASSLLAVVHGCREIAEGRARMVLAGGVDLSLDPFELVGFSRAGALARDRMRVFDRRSTGFLPGEGSGMVVLMALEEALARGLRPYAVLRGWGVSSDGSAAITRPESGGQLLALERAYRIAGFSPRTVGYFEAHGTGTAIGDAAEAAALSALVGAPEPGRPRPVLGSVKALIGHTKAAAGVAGLIKAALAVHTQVLPPTSGCEQPIGALVGPDARLRTTTEPEAWCGDHPPRAGVSSMGFGGINAHLVLEGTAAHRRTGLDRRTARLGAAGQDAELWVFADGSPADLRERLERAAELAVTLTFAQQSDLAASLARDPGQGPWRAAVVAPAGAGLPALLREAAAAVGERVLGPRVFTAPPVGTGPGPRIGFLFSGQAASVGSGGGLLARRFAEIGRFLDGLALPEGDPALDTSVAQPRIAAASVASLRALDALGVHADVGLGHSLGELTALHWAGALDASALLDLVAARGTAMAASKGERGAMAAVARSARAVRGLLPEGAVVACVNGPEETVVSGTEDAVERVVRDLGGRRLPVARAFHSPLVEPAVPAFRAALERTRLGPPRRFVASTVTGGPLAARTDLREHLVRQVTDPVLFSDALAAAGDVDVWVEAGPDGILAGLAAAQGRTAFAVRAGSPALSGLLSAAAAAWALGRPVRTAALHQDRFTRPLDPDRRPVFLANPCETAPAAAAPEPEHTASARTAGAPVPVGADASGEQTDAVAAVRALVAERVELPLDSVGPGTGLRADLHMNSIAVAQLIAEAARRLDLPVPSHLTEYSAATVAEIAELLSNGAGTAAASETQDTVPGVEGWARVFTVEDVERPLGPVPEGVPTGRATVVAAPGDGLAAALAECDLGDGTVVLRPGGPGGHHEGLDLVARAVGALSGAERLVVVQDDSGPDHATAAGFARSVHLERGLPTAVVTVTDTDPAAAGHVTAETALLAAFGGHRECRYRTDGHRSEPRMRHRPLVEPPSEQAPFGPDDVVLVTGGGKGIGAECAREIARRTGARIVLMGRSDPSEDTELSANLERLSADGVHFSYLRADVLDADAVRGALAGVVRETGPVTGVLHAAGTNEPAALEELDRDRLERAVAPKVEGARNVAAALDPAALRWFVSFGSLIARTGLPGEAHYALANEWLGRVTSRIGAALPEGRALTLDWSVWSGAGMGERLGSLDALVRRGIDPIPLDAGLDLMYRLLAAPDAADRLVVTGRYGDAPTLLTEERDVPMLRFLERVRRLVPGVELVADVSLSAATDPYLDHHAFEGDRLLPAVMGIEAMAQAASVLLDDDRPAALSEVEFSAPVVVGDDDTVLRVAALARPDGTVRTVLRSSATGFAVDHFSAVYEAKAEASRERTLTLATVPDADVPLDPGERLYGGLFFQGGPLRRVRGYRRLTGFDCVADLSGTTEDHWFARHLPQRLLMGDAGRRDAAIHALQASLPGHRLLPVGVERVTVFDTEACDAVLHARERWAADGEHVFDMEAVDDRGTVLERWEGLRLRMMGPGPRPMGPELLAPYVERRGRDLIGVTDLRAAVESGDTPIRRRARAVHRLLGVGVTVRGRPDGRPELSSGDHVSVTHCGPFTLVATGSEPVGVDLVRLDEVPDDPGGLIGDEGGALVAAVAEARPDAGPQYLAAVVWAAREAARKCAGRPGGPLVLGHCDGPWTVFAAGNLTVAVLRDGDHVVALAGGPAGGGGHA